MRIFLICICSLIWFSCNSSQNSCDGKWQYARDIDSSLASLSAYSDYVLLIVDDSAAHSTRLDSHLNAFPCLADSVQQAFKAIHRISPATDAPKGSLSAQLKQFQKEHKLILPYGLILGRNDSVFSFTSFGSATDAYTQLEEGLTFLLSEIHNPNLRNDISFLSGKEDRKWLYPAYYKWVSEIYATGAYDAEKHVFLVSLFNPKKQRIISDRGNAREYMQGLRIVWDTDSLSELNFQWLNTPRLFKDPVLNKSYYAYTDSLIQAQLSLPSEMKFDSDLWPSYLVFSAYLPRRDVAIDAIRLEIKPSNISPEGEIEN